MIIDRQKALDELGIPEDIYDELLHIFIAQTDLEIHDLTDAVQSQNLEKAAKTAHSIKGSAVNLRIDDIHNLAKEIESDAKGNKDIKSIAEKTSKLKAMFEELKKM